MPPQYRGRSAGVSARCPRPSSRLAHRWTAYLPSHARREKYKGADSMRKIAILLMLFLSPLILPTQVRALEDTRAVKFPYGTFLYNYGFNSIMLWAQFGSTDLVVNFWYKMTNLSTST